MDFFSKIFPLFSCALAIGICWYREANSAVVTLSIKKKYWYAGFELLIALIIAAHLVKWLY